MVLKKTVTFGVFADSHYARRPNDTERFFQNSLIKLQRCTELFRQCQVDFLVCLGDLIDCSADDRENAQQLQEVLEVLETVPAPLYLCMGNHDISAGVRTHCRNLPERYKDLAKGYQSFDVGEMHFIILDTCYDEAGRYYTPETLEWKRLYVDSKQLNWLKKDLESSGKRTIVFSHANLDPREKEGTMDPHVLMNHRDVREILESSHQVDLVLQGHCHAGFASRINGIPYLTLKAMVEGPEQIPAMVVTCNLEKQRNTMHFLQCVPF